MHAKTLSKIEFFDKIMLSVFHLLKDDKLSSRSYQYRLIWQNI